MNDFLPPAIETCLTDSNNQDLALEYHLEKDLEKILCDQDLLDLRTKCIKAQNELNHSNRKFVKKIPNIYMMHNKSRYKNSL